MFLGVEAIHKARMDEGQYVCEVIGMEMRHGNSCDAMQIDTSIHKCGDGCMAAVQKHARISRLQ